MRWITVLIIPLLVILLPTAAYAIDHWGGAPSGRAPTSARAIVAMVASLLVMVILAWILRVLLPGAPWRCSLFVAVAGVAAMTLFTEYLWIILYHQWIPLSDRQEGLGWLLKVIVLWPMVVAGASCCLSRPKKWAAALAAAIVAATASEALPYIVWLVWRPGPS